MRSPTNKPVRLALALSLLVCCVGCDQTTKYVATKSLCGTPPLSCLSDTLRLEYALNPGGFLSVGCNLPPQPRFWVFVALNTMFLVGAVCILVAKWNMPLANFVALVLVLAGGIGNVIDRVLHNGLVTDFLNLGIGPVRTGIFNVADMVLTVGGLALVLTYRGSSKPNCHTNKVKETTPVQGGQNELGNTNRH
jgi:signal peptidase II